jgi:hypothetical protein
VGSKWDVLGNLSPEVMLPSDPYQESFSWENLVMDKAQIKWSEEPEPEWLMEAIAAHPDYDEYLAQPILTPATSRPESPARDDEPEEPESPATGKGKKKKKGKGPPPAPTPKKVKIVQPPPPPKLRRRQTPPPEVPDYPQSLPSTFHVPKKVYKVSVTTTLVSLHANLMPNRSCKYLRVEPSLKRIRRSRRYAGLTLSG